MKKYIFPTMPAPKPTDLSGLQKVCRIYGGMIFTKDGQTTEMVWDYFTEKAVNKKDFTREMEKLSERAKYMKATGQLP